MLMTPSGACINTTVLWQSAVTTTSPRGASIPSYPSGVEIPAGVQPKSVTRIEGQQIISRTIYAVYLLSDPGVKIDDHFVWGSKTLVATGPAMDQAGHGQVFKVDCTLYSQ